MISKTMLFKDLFLGKNKSRFSTALLIAEQLLQKIKLPCKLEESRLVDTIYHLDQIRSCYAEIDFIQKSFYFDPIRLSFTNVTYLINKICINDSYLFKHITEDKPVVIDAGAHIGVFSRFVLSEKQGATVYALEPDRENYKLLAMNLKNFSKANAVQKAVLDKKDFLDFYTSRKIDWRSTLIPSQDSKYAKQFNEGEMTTQYRVEVTDIDSFVSDSAISRLDFLKITIGSFEAKVLAGAAQTISHFRPQVAMLSYSDNYAQVKRFFEEIGGYREQLSPFPTSSKDFVIRIFIPD